MVKSRGQFGWGQGGMQCWNEEKQDAPVMVFLSSTDARLPSADALMLGFGV